jgi:ATP-dependent RNA helicase RhlE
MGISVARMHGNRSQAQRTDALAGFKDGRYQVLAATDIVARGIDVEALDHVVNFDVPAAPEDYIHRVGRTARAEATGEAYTFVSPDEEGDVRQIERVLGRRIDRRTLPDFDYAARAQDRFEVPIEDRIAEIRARKADERARRRAKVQAAAGAPPAPGKPLIGVSGRAVEQRAAPSEGGERRRRRRGGRGRRG